ncbi:MAG: biotin--[acetyl-CoA-carboxylase] ligase [Chromatiales bacterium]|nr:biotin--[acetyl-CoA-carboxylase] ligase [Chromatiales bacterium]
MDGDWHSGVDLGQALGLSRAAIWKQVRALRALGLTIAADRGRGYRLAAPLDLLSEPAIRAALEPATLQALESLDILVVTTSTNDCLTSRPAPPPARLRAVAAEYQTGGRGRRGRRWLSPLGHGICLSVSWCFEIAPRDLPALSLVAGVAVAGALDGLGIGGVQLKWPNDIVAAGGKLGGILVEVAGEPGGPLRAVIGIGLNARPMPGISAALKDEGGAMPALALDELTAGRQVPRNALVAALLNTLHGSLRTFGASGARTFLAEWRRRDCLAGRPVVVTRGQESFTGVACGLADDGALLVDRNGTIVPVVAGDVTLRVPG